ncbi:hypothetical protein SAMN03159496_06110 [Rhizobium sp. NFR07]|uniref:hypothetical protein n=1 Tax=Rhizobium sp. NFR07 TaxID=1566262 RepID=UPI0008F1461D|nr:hypothetical protein [Rhizobium sp. NFR07]SFB62912.1 hypothetical protein SAMN03159496_06110 [Rhizobium sp. NFR07]
MRAQKASLDPLTRATVTIAWVICLNKPFYPIYVWYLVGHGVSTSLGSLLAAPAYLAIPFLARRSPIAARAALPLVGAFDTLFETQLFGQASGTELFFGACIMLVAVSFRADEKWIQRGLAVVVFAVFFLSRHSGGPPYYGWSGADLAALSNLNIFAVACLMAFIAMRYAGIAIRAGPTNGNNL